LSHWPSYLVSLCSLCDLHLEQYLLKFNFPNCLFLETLFP